MIRFLSLIHPYVLAMKPPEEVPKDWFKLSGATGKIRLSFKWGPVDLSTAQGDRSKAVIKEPIGMLKVKIKSASDVANVETFRKSDPYVKLSISKNLVGATVGDN
jgi:Ca2+-dependent lipid-binding protein